jgi:hypothetical protein
MVVNAQMKEAFLRQHQQRAIECATNGHVIVVAGVRSGNLPPLLEQHPSVISFTGDDAQRQTLPKNVGLLLGTRFMQHGTWDALARQAKARGAAVFPTALTTGELRALLAPITNIGVKRKPEPQAQAAPAPAREQHQDVEERTRQIVKKGELRDFIAVYADLNANVLIKEAERLMPIAAKLGIATTLGSLCQGIRVARTRRDFTIIEDKQEAAAQTVQPAPEPAAEVTPEPTPAAPESTPSTLVASEPERTATIEDDVLRLFDDAIRQCSDAAAAMQLAKDRYLSLLHRQSSSAAVREQLMELARKL